MSTDLQKYTPAQIAKIGNMKEAIKVKNVADAAALFYKAQDDFQTAQKAKEYSMRSARRAGELLDDAKRGIPKPFQADLNGLSPYKQMMDDAGISYQTSIEWQKIAYIADVTFESYFLDREFIGREYSIIDLMRFANEGIYSSNLLDWETPQWFFDLLDNEFHFTLDVCANSKNAKCKQFFSESDNGLKQEWQGICWMNPPYGSAISKWIAKAKQESEKLATVVCLVPARTDTEWWWNNCIFGEIRFLKGRLKFGGGKNCAPFPSAIVIFEKGRRRKVIWWDTNLMKN